jgi:hypothetical protein
MDVNTPLDNLEAMIVEHGSGLVAKCRVATQTVPKEIGTM